MKEALSIETERMDGLPLLITHMQRMNLAELLDKHIPTHGHRKGLSVGELSVVWLAHILSQADHRMNRVQEWASRRLETLQGCSLEALRLRDLTDDRLADVLRLLSDDVHWQAFEQEPMGQLVRIYDLPARCVRIDTTTASSYADVDEQGLLQLGHSKDHLITVCRVDSEGKSTCIAASGMRPKRPSRLRWMESRSPGKSVGDTVQSMATAQAAQKSLQERLQQAQQTLLELTARRQGKTRLTERTQTEKENVFPCSASFLKTPFVCSCRQILLSLIIARHGRPLP